ncbi:Fic family protein [Pseudomonas fluorescens]
MLQALCVALGEAIRNDPVTDQVTDQVARLLLALRGGASLKVSELMGQLGLAHKATFRGNYLKPALAAGLVEMTDPESPTSPSNQPKKCPHLSIRAFLLFSNSLPLEA